eukprot:3414747-Alexandrium_andersonii.AAC.1
MNGQDIWPVAETLSPGFPHIGVLTGKATVRALTPVGQQPWTGHQRRGRCISWDEPIRAFWAQRSGEDWRSQALEGASSWNAYTNEFVMWFLECETSRRFASRTGLDVDTGLSTDGPFLVSADYL